MKTFRIDNETERAFCSNVASKEEGWVPLRVVKLDNSQAFFPKDNNPEAKKKKTKTTAACSVINPLTSSDSASAKSKGALLVSAIEPIKNIIKIINNGNINQIVL